MSSFFQSMIEFADKFTDLIDDHSKWSQETFGTDQERGPIGPLKHLVKETQETLEAIKQGDPELTKMELADCLLLLLDASRRAGIKPMQLLEAAQKKLAILKTRHYPRPEHADDAVEHCKFYDVQYQNTDLHSCVTAWERVYARNKAHAAEKVSELGKVIEVEESANQNLKFFTVEYVKPHSPPSVKRDSAACVIAEDSETALNIVRQTFHTNIINKITEHDDNEQFL